MEIYEIREALDCSTPSVLNNVTVIFLEPV